jgi:pyridoxamine 5'-phosphate oxidase
MEAIMNRDDIAQMRRSYTLAGLSELSMNADPFAQFDVWFQEARALGTIEANAMTLATASPDGMPSARIVLLKDVDERGFTFYTNYNSAKGRDIAANPRVSLSFFWGELERQVRISGTVEQISREDSETYFRSRPVESQLGAWASEQSSVIASREILEERFLALQAEYNGRDIPLPPFWGGYRVMPSEMEFWQGRIGRLHDRLVYSKNRSAKNNVANTVEWVLTRLSP